MKVMKVFFRLVPTVMLIVSRIAEARDAASDGGRRITKKESKAIIKEVFPLFSASVEDVLMSEEED